MTTETMAPFLADLTRRVDLTLLYPPFRDRYLETLVACHERGTDYHAISGFRSWDEQNALWAQGREKKDHGWVVTNPAKLVTKARAGASAHNYGIAVDSCCDADRDRAGLQPDWNLPDYETLAQEAKRARLEAAYFWTHFREGPHVQLPLSSKGITLHDLHVIYQRGGIPAVWDRLDSMGGW